MIMDVDELISRVEHPATHGQIRRRDKLLRLLADENRRQMSMRLIAEILEVAPSTVHADLHELQADGLIERAECPCCGAAVWSVATVSSGG